MASSAAPKRFDFVVVSNRLPVEPNPLGGMQWHSSPGGLASALQPVILKTGGAWVGWTGEATSPVDEARPARNGEPEGWPGSRAAASWWRDTGEVQAVEVGSAEAGGGEGMEDEGVYVVPVHLSGEEVAGYYEGFCNATLWPLYHDLTATPVFSRRWWHLYVEVNQRFASAVAAHASSRARVWAHDYHLQLFPAMLRGLRPDLRVGFFNHIPFPPYELFAQMPWRKEILEGLLGADLVGFQTSGGAANFLRACERLTSHDVVGDTVWVGRGAREGARPARVGAFPISVDAAELSALARSDAVRARAGEIRRELGGPEVLLLGVDRLDYTKGLLHRLRAYGELLAEERLRPPRAVLVQIASPSRDEVEQYRRLREEVERVVGSINGDFSALGHPAVHYLHQSFPKEEMAAFYAAADVALVTPIRDGMNLVAKEYVACCNDLGGRLVLSEFTGSALELAGAFLVNPHDIDAMKAQIMAAVEASPEEAKRRMKQMREAVFGHDVHRWAAEFLGALERANLGPKSQLVASLVREG